jgi:hypothetical protein
MQTESEKMFMRVLSTLNESQARWFVAMEALKIGRGGIVKMHSLTRMSRKTILKGIDELKGRNVLNTSEGIRKKGGGRDVIEMHAPGFTKALEKIMQENTGGDPMSSLLWTSESTEKIAAAMKKLGFEVSSWTIQSRLAEMDYTLQSNSKTKEGSSPAERNSQFLEIEKAVKTFTDKGFPVISIDAKKKEKIGDFKNPGKNWQKKGNPIQSNVYDFPSLSKGTATLYGGYDQIRNEGFVNVGTSADTAEFAVNSIRQWWKLIGSKYYQGAPKILLCADGGGSNSSRSRLWKFSLQTLADELNREIHVCHYPPGTSKWNKIEHRMFSYISINWRGRPLTSYEVVLKLIGSTTTKKGLKIKAKLDTKTYEKGIKISDPEMEEINIKFGKVNPKWNYVIKPNL